jgi:phosphohistidine phosphatase
MIMTRELLLFRHGKSDWSAGVDDYRRPLKDRGKRGAQRIGVWLAQQKIQPELVVTSPAERALVTAQKACKAMGDGDQGIHKDKRIYAAGLDELIEVLGDCSQDAGRVMLVGHNPGLEELLVWLVSDAVVVPDDGKLLPTATLARLQMPADWRELKAGCARLDSITRPGTLPKKFPYPGPDGKELRDRPAYYYTQSSVIPYRLRDGKPEILVIASSKKHHLVVPKGIKDPGLSPRESAAKEALEEAGIEGEIAETALGSYTCEKWGATCTVAVYPMKVTRVIAEEDWEERHRGREWVTPDMAASRLKQEELRPLVKKLEATL